ncbi:MAG: MBOAT family protein [Oscillospiraceae bacterium]|nr:MBOAT family protein [Oscillospiraceae bacterium]
MNFQSFSFWGFFLVTLAGAYLAGRKSASAGKTVLLLASLFFCLQAGFGGLLVLMISTYVSYLASANLKGRKAALLAVVSAHVLVLCGFKYIGFLTGNAVTAPFVPLGLSFFTFQQIRYLKEVYEGKAQRAESARDFFLFSFFFPTLSSGPITDAQGIFPQLEGKTLFRATAQDVSAALYAIIIGCGKKVLLADAFGVIVNNGFAHPERLTTVDSAMVILAYTLQLYFDFSGYCDMATGLARLFGIRLPLNFNSPYRALSIGDFWHRWHITLTTFLRECVYFPLGGSRRGTARTYLNIFLIYLISGIWHGAGWTFILWGALHGAAQVAERFLGKKRQKLPPWLQWALTFAFVNAAWVFFRAPDISSALAIFKGLFSLEFIKPMPWLAEGLFTAELEVIRILLPALAPYRTLLAVAVLFIVGFAAALWPRNAMERMETFRPTVWRTVSLVIIAAWSALSFAGITTFIYANF